MAAELHYDTLDRRRQELLPLLKGVASDYYLAGGTALALEIGHRRSLDFDFFTAKPIATVKLFNRLKKIFRRHRIKKIQEEKDTLSVLIDNRIKLSFFSYPYPLLDRPLRSEYFRLAALADIGCMKLAALVSRAALKDYVDLYFILQRISLAKLLSRAAKKLPDIDANLILKSLVYYDDLEKEPIVWQRGKKVTWAKIKRSLTQAVKNQRYY